MNSNSQFVEERLRPLLDQRNEEKFKAEFDRLGKSFSGDPLADFFDSLNDEQKKWVINATYDLFSEEEHEHQALNTIATTVLEAGLTLGLDFKVTEEGLYFSPAALEALLVDHPEIAELTTTATAPEAIAQAGVPRPFAHPEGRLKAAESLQNAFANRTADYFKTLPKGEPPNSNNYDLAALLLNIANGWMPPVPICSSADDALSNICTAFSVYDPNRLKGSEYVSDMLFGTLYDDRHLLKIATELAEALKLTAKLGA